ncbi:MAG: hypothetical protein ACYC21_14495 [Eubacteriales bacterium]
MKDSALQVTVTGIIGSIVIDLIMFLVLLSGVKVTPPWEIAANVFLTTKYLDTASGVILGLIGTIALGIASASLILLILKWTGYDYAVLKGILVTNAFGFLTMGLFMTLLKISPWIKSETVTNYLALIVLTIAGAVMSTILKIYGVRIQSNS